MHLYIFPDSDRNVRKNWIICVQLLANFFPLLVLEVLVRKVNSVWSPSRFESVELSSRLLSVFY